MEIGVYFKNATEVASVPSGSMLLTELDGKIVRIKKSNLVKDFLTYLGYHSQSGETAPVVKDINGAGVVAPIIDEIGGAWSYLDVGTYRYTKMGAFANIAKVDVLLGVNANQQSQVLIKPTVTANYIQFEVGNATSYLNNAITLNDDKLNLQRIEIRVYK